MKRTLTHRLGQFVNIAECLLDATPATPEPIASANVNVSMFEILANYKINFSIAWMQPNATYGAVTAYEVVVTKDPLVGEDSTESSAVIFRNTGTFMFNVSNHNNIMVSFKCTVSVLR